MTVVTVGSFHVFTQNSTLPLYLPLKIQFWRGPPSYWFSLVNVWILQKQLLLYISYISLIYLGGAAATTPAAAAEEFSEQAWSRAMRAGMKYSRKGKPLTPIYIYIYIYQHLLIGVRDSYIYIYTYNIYIYIYTFRYYTHI